MKIAIQGIVGSFHHQAAVEKFPNQSINLIECETFREVFDSVSNESANFGIVAIENSLHGSINPVYRLLSKKELWVCGEIRLKIDLFLITHSSIQNLSSIKHVISQAEAISQCQLWLHENLPEVSVEEFHDTAASVQKIINNKDPHYAAIASKNSTKIHGGTITAGPINDDPENYTRFFVLSKKPAPDSNANRTSIIIEESFSDSPGTLFDALSVFKDLNINLSKLDSHPLPGKLRRYAFYLDFDTSIESPSGAKAISNLRTQGWKVKILGSYVSS